ncbi:uncharacterized protein L969DRAFT_84336 [Mixia osmundae IAM 14324]|uniref:cystathionine beta-synthase n=1 Tax=Mixia osmundae (strain CBS 9802 / IAM 14324 / JCM 22182 / KY 12970) TaxID=764103 RepID=G7E356_MIXOS|nr:uncharacterized protein L969DRAFT_84336 [Mixia osmundae IAM 14324]KEI42478.1 hypothetical protein L969DRAFT_84336 [Mixia osmundae IAM 14324]GAA97237.1 hypothetical protein E5Q_03913 [Mixia osmundae IAM 14324]
MVAAKRPRSTDDIGPSDDAEPSKSDAERREAEAAKTLAGLGGPQRLIKAPKPPPTCGFCGATFKKTEHKQRHEMTHTLERPFPCKVCDRRFARKDTLDRHFKSKHGSVQESDPTNPLIPGNPLPTEQSSSARLFRALQSRVGSLPLPGLESTIPIDARLSDPMTGNIAMVPAALPHDFTYNGLNVAGAHGVFDSITGLIGHTPLVRMRKIANEEGIRCNLLAKCEFFNAGGSVKDRIAKRMIEVAEASGELIPGQSIIIEPTSGNTGIGLALMAAVKGYRCIITLPDKMSLEKENTLRALGAEIRRTPTHAAWDSPDSHIGLAKRLAAEIPGAVILNQYDNPQNPQVHYETTGGEILTDLARTALIDLTTDPNSQVSDQVHLFVAGAGTGGTISGTARRLREHNALLIVVGADPIGSVLARPETLNTNGTNGYSVEGIGYDFVPTVLDHSAVNSWVKTTDENSFAMTRRIIRTEGILCGGSSGAAVWAALHYLKESPDGQAIAADPNRNVVIILPDGIRNVISKDWLRE